MQETAEISSPIIRESTGIQMLSAVVLKTKSTDKPMAMHTMIQNGNHEMGATATDEELKSVDLDDDDDDGGKGMDVDNYLHEELENVVDFIRSLPDREIVIMQVARYLASALPFRAFILGNKERKYRNMHFVQDLSPAEKDEKQKETESIYGDAEKGREAKQLIRIEKFVYDKIKEWMGSITGVYGTDSSNSVKTALENDVVAQVRSSHAARLIVNVVYGLDVSW
mmetsp:Transcript_50035/g.83332  ORF Transcript_50035/g.83332 Transcript_50035/m.83332 type:complete len:225 (-) Transcript_50035:88-762(-)